MYHVIDLLTNVCYDYENMRLNYESKQRFSRI